MNDMQPTLTLLAKSLKVPTIEEYRLCICYSKLGGWYFIDTDGTPSYAYHNLRHYYDSGALQWQGFVEMIEKLNKT